MGTCGLNNCCCSIQILDCYSDPLGWKDQLMMSGNFTDVSYEVSLSLSCVCRNVKDLDKLYSLILELGKGNFCMNFLLLLGFVCEG